VNTPILSRQNKIYNQNSSESPQLRALIEIDGGELRIYPLVDNDQDEKLVLEALRFIREDFCQ
jgi:hypothetical protein